MEKYLKIVIVSFGILALGNLLFLDYFLIKGKDIEKAGTVGTASKINEMVGNVIPRMGEELPTKTSVSEVGVDFSCNDNCLAIIRSEVQKVVGALPTPTPIIQPTPQMVQSSSQTKVIYLPIISSATTTQADWTDISSSDFYFNLTDYTGVKEVQWEASLKSFLAYNTVSARLYDVTNKRAVDFSQLETQSAAFDFLRSPNISIWRGNNLYRVQMKTPSGSLATLGQARLKIILE